MQPLLKPPFCQSTYLNGIDVIGDHNQLSFLLLNEGGDGVDTMTDNGSTLGGGILLASSASLGSLAKPGLLVLLGLRPVVVQELEQLGGCKDFNLH